MYHGIRSRADLLAMFHGVKTAATCWSSRTAWPPLPDAHVPLDWDTEIGQRWFHVIAAAARAAPSAERQLHLAFADLEIADGGEHHSVLADHEKRRPDGEVLDGLAMSGRARSAGSRDALEGLMVSCCCAPSRGRLAEHEDGTDGGPSNLRCPRPSQETSARPPGAELVAESWCRWTPSPRSRADLQRPRVRQPRPRPAVRQITSSPSAST